MRTPTILLVTGALGIAAIAPATAQSRPDAPIGATAPIRLTAEDGRPTRSYQSPSLIIAPDDPQTVVAAAMETSSNTCSVLRSTDTGQTWTPLDATPSPDAYPLCFEGAVYGYHNETPIARGRNGTLYWGLTGKDPGADPENDLSVLVARSVDNGDTWDFGVAFDGADGEAGRTRQSRPVTALAVDTTSGSADIVYVGWEAWPEDPRTQTMIAVSTDGGQTFSEPRKPFSDEVGTELGGPEGLETLPPQLAVADDGTLYVAFPGNPTADDEPNRLLLARSDDRGETFTVTTIWETRDANSTSSLQWTPDGGPQGTIHVVYEDRLEPPLGTRDIQYQQSTDGGATFTAPRTLNDDDPQQRFGHYNPRMSVAPNGRIDVAWWDFRDGGARYANDVYYTYSDDGGATWASNVRVTDQSINRRIGIWSNGADIRSPPGIASTDAAAVFAWSDSRLATAIGQNQDIYAATVQLTPLPPQSGSPVLLYVIAVLGGLSVAGVGLILAGASLRRQGVPVSV